MVWENETKKETQQLYPLQKAPSHFKTKQEDSLLLVQCILCIAAIIFVLLVRNMDEASFGELQTEFGTMLSTGIDFGEETGLVRFVSGSIEAVRTTTGDWLESLDAITMQGSGGFWPVKKKEVPEGASLKAYTLEETLALPVQGTLTSAFGFRKNPVNGEDDFHAGIDIAAAEGTSVITALSGQVTETGYSASRGNYLVVHHRGGLQTLYQHLSCSLVRNGESVADGQVIATVGSTGLSTGSHLHFELIVDGLRVNPLTQFPQLSA